MCRLHDADRSGAASAGPGPSVNSAVLGRHALSRATAFGPDTSSIARRRNRCGDPVLLLNASLHEISLRLALPHHLAAVGIERVVDDPFRSIERVIVGIAEMPKAFSNRLESWPFRLLVEGVVRIRAIHDAAEQDQRRIGGQPVLLQNSLERTLLAMMAELDVLDVIWDRVEPPGLVITLSAS